MTSFDESAAAGQKLIDSKKAQGEPGTPNPHTESTQLSSADVLKQIDSVLEQNKIPPRSDENRYNPVPAAERTMATENDARNGQMVNAISALQAARAALTMQAESDARLKSDPRYERDQKIFEMGKTGKLAMVPPTEAEKAAQAARSGLPPEVLEKIPSTPSEQVQDDMKRLQQGEQRAKELNPVIKAGEQDGAPQNNFTKAKDAGANTGDRAPKDEGARSFDTGEGNENVIK